jgi:hypothetical protein
MLYHNCFSNLIWNTLLGGSKEPGRAEIECDTPALAYADDVTIGGENVDTIKKNTEALLDISKEVGLEVNPEKTKYMLKSRSQKIGQKHSMKIVNRSFEDVAKFKYLATTLTSKLHA